MHKTNFRISEKLKKNHVNSHKNSKSYKHQPISIPIYAYMSL